MSTRYIANFVKRGFQVEALGIRESGEEPIDRVNMVRLPSKLHFLVMLTAVVNSTLASTVQPRSEPPGNLGENKDYGLWLVRCRSRSTTDFECLPRLRSRDEFCYDSCF